MSMKADLLSLVAPPDCENYTGLYPQTQQSSFVVYPALDTSIGGTTPFTVAIWVRFFGFQPGWTTVVGAVGSGGAETDFIMTAVNSGINMLLGHAGYGTFQLNDPERKRWYYLALTYDGAGTVTFYVDGAPWGALQTSVSAIQSPAFTIGRNATEPPIPNSSHSVTGQIRNLTVWNTRLTDDEVLGQMWAQTPSVHTDALLIATDFTQSPPIVRAGPVPVLTQAYFQMEANCLWPFAPSAPGAATKINPGGGAPFSLIAWVSAGAPWMPSVTAFADPATDPAPTGVGCLLTNRDRTDSGHFAFLLDTSGVPTVQFGTGASMQTVSAPSTPITQGQWVNLAVTYDGTTCSIYVNGTLAAAAALTIASPTSVPAPYLLGRLNGGRPADVFQGVMQYLSVWNISLSASQVSSLMYSDPTGVTGCVANFAGSENPPQDLFQLNDAVWDSNVLVASSPGYVSLAAMWGGVNPAGVTAALSSAAPILQKLRFSNPRVLLPSRQPPTQAFGPEHKALALAELARVSSSIKSGLVREALHAKYDAALDQAFADALAGRTPTSAITVTVEGTILIVTDTATGTVLGLYEVDVSPQCAAWWLSFIFTFVSGFLTIIGLPTPTEKLQALAARVVTDPAVLAVLATVEGVTLTGGVMLQLLKVLYDAGYLWSVVKIAAMSLGWWGAAKVIGKVILYLNPVPNPQQAIYISNSAVAVAQLVIALGQYQSKCGSGDACAV